MPIEKLLFVYNADSGRWNGYLDMAHKIFSPATYPCSLCDLTHGVFKIRPMWADFVAEPPVPFEFLHRDEFEAAFPDLKKTVLPVVFKVGGGAVSVFILSEELSGFATIGALKTAILARLAAAE